MWVYNSDQEEKEGDWLNGNRIINLKNLITNIDKFLVCKECDVEKLIDYVEDYFQLTPPDTQYDQEKKSAPSLNIFVLGKFSIFGFYVLRKNLS